MKRSLIILLVVIVLAGYLGTLIARDPGYVLVTYDGYSLQTSLWVLLGLLTGLSLGVYLLVRAFSLQDSAGDLPGFSYRIELEEGLVRIIGQASKFAKGLGGGPGL